MSNVDAEPAETECVAGAPADIELLLPREVPLGGPRAMLVRRSLPNRDRRMVGAWCFADSYGPDDIVGQAGMQVPPHPHIGLQTVTWLVRGEVLHQDSLGSRRVVHPGSLSLMTAGRGIAHSEQSPPENSGTLYGAQLWVALPTSVVAPAFEHHETLPSRDGVTVMLGSVGDLTSPATTHTPIVGAALAVPGELVLPLRVDFEHAVLALSDGLAVEGVEVPVGAMVYLGPGRDRARVTGSGDALLLGGEPFGEDLVMWWNFVGRSHDDIDRARADWERDRETDVDGRRFGAVRGYDGPALPAPALPTTRLKARSRYRAHD